jgi:hypothetical protein
MMAAAALHAWSKKAWKSKKSVCRTDIPSELNLSCIPSESFRITPLVGIASAVTHP